MLWRTLQTPWRGERRYFAEKPVEAPPSMRWSSPQQSPAEPLLPRMSTISRHSPSTRTALMWRGYETGTLRDYGICVRQDWTRRQVGMGIGGCRYLDRESAFD